MPSLAKSSLPTEELRRPFGRVLGWWDYTMPGTTLGSLLIFLAECELVAKLCHAGAVDVAVDAGSHNIENVLPGEWRLLEAGECKGAALSVLAGVDLVGDVYACGGNAGFQALSANLTKSHLTWPLAGKNARATYDTTQYVQALWREVGRSPRLAFKPELREWADDVLRRQFGDRPVVALHLKNVPHQAPTSISLADKLAWYDFVAIAKDLYDIVFLLAGDDPVEERMSELRNVAVGCNLGADSFGKHLALLGQCQGFMGMMSSVCNLALFTDIPYAIFKNPDHHRNEMLLEIGVEDHYPFATRQQKIFRVHETSALLLSELERMPFVKGTSR